MEIKDGDWKLFSHDPEIGRSVWFIDDGERIHWRCDYQVEKLVTTNAEQRAIAAKGWAGDYHHIASIPLNIVHDQGVVDAMTQQDDKFLSKWLNDSDNRAWRTKEGKV